MTMLNHIDYGALKLYYELSLNTVNATIQYALNISKITGKPVDIRPLLAEREEVEYMLKYFDQ